MTTLTVMKARIASELRRSNITTQIADAINTAITAYEHERFYVSESRENTFNTVASQEFYSSVDAPFLASLTKIDFVFVEIQNTKFELIPIQTRLMEGATSTSITIGTPVEYNFYEQKLRFYPIPSDIWPIIVGGVSSVAAPLTDGEANNFWMTKAERLIRSRAKQELALHVLKDVTLAQMMGGAAEEAYEQLNVRTTRITKTGGGKIKPMNF